MPLSTSNQIFKKNDKNLNNALKRNITNAGGVGPFATIKASLCLGIRKDNGSPSAEVFTPAVLHCLMSHPFVLVDGC